MEKAQASDKWQILLIAQKLLFEVKAFIQIGDCQYLSAAEM